MFHLGRRPADRFQFEACCRLHRVFGLLGYVPLYGLYHPPSHGGLLNQGVPDEVAGGLVFSAVEGPALVLL